MYRVWYHVGNVISDKSFCADHHLEYGIMLELLSGINHSVLTITILYESFCADHHYSIFYFVIICYIYYLSLSSYYWQDDSSGVPDAHSDCTKCVSECESCKFEYMYMLYIRC